MKKLVAIMALSFGLIFSSYAQEKAPQMRERKMNDSCKMMTPQDNQKKIGERKDFDGKGFYARPQMRHGMRGFEGPRMEGRMEMKGKMDGRMEMKGKMEEMKGRPMMNRPTEGRPTEGRPMYMRGRGMRGNMNMYHNFPPKPEQKVEKNDVKVEIIVPATKIRKGPSVDESTLSMEDFLLYINYKE